VKKILACAFVVKTHVVDAVLLVRARKVFAARQRVSMAGGAKSPYFIAVFACCVQRAQSCGVLSSPIKSYRARALSATLRDALRGADTRFVKSNTVFFIAL